MPVAITYVRAPAFDSLADLLDWSELHGVELPRVEQGPDGTFRGSVETGDGDIAPAGRRER